MVRIRCQNVAGQKISSVCGGDSAARLGCRPAVSGLPSSAGVHLSQSHQSSLAVLHPQLRSRAVNSRSRFRVLVNAKSAETDSLDNLQQAIGGEAVEQEMPSGQTSADTEWAQISFYQDSRRPAETVIPQIDVNKSRTQTVYNVRFVFMEPDIFKSGAMSDEMGNAEPGVLPSIRGMYMRDNEGEIYIEGNQRDWKMTTVQNVPKALTVCYIMKGKFKWDRFKRFMDRYSKANKLEFEQAAQPVDKKKELQNSLKEQQ